MNFFSYKLVTMVVVIITGHNKVPEVWEQSLEIYQSHSKISKVLVCTWNGESFQCKSTEKLQFIYLDKITPPAEWNVVKHKTAYYQSYTYSAAIAHLSDNNLSNEDTLILKSRPDVIISHEQLNSILTKDLDDKVWIPWAHRTKKLYIADECYCSTMKVLKKMYSNMDVTLESSYGQGHSHVQCFNHYKVPESNYVEWLNENFVIETIENGVLFREWNVGKGDLGVHLYFSTPNKRVAVFGSDAPLLAR